MLAGTQCYPVTKKTEEILGRVHFCQPMHNATLEQENIKKYWAGHTHVSWKRENRRNARNKLLQVDPEGFRAGSIR